MLRCLDQDLPYMEYSKRGLAHSRKMSRIISFYSVYNKILPVVHLSNSNFQVVDISVIQLINELYDS